MGYTYVGSNRKIKAYLGSDSGFIKVDRMYYGNIRVYPNAGNVTYVVDDGISYIEEVDIDDSCLSPTTFTPTKSGWTFIGWREDTSANGTILSSKIMDGNDVTLYAVFRQTITLSYNGNGATGGSTSNQIDYRYYNNGNITNPSFVLRNNGFSKTYYTFTKWAMGSVGGTQYAVGARVTLTSNTTFYAVWTAKTVYRSVTKYVKTAINNWHSTRSLVEYGYTFVSNPSVSISGDSGASVSTPMKSCCVVQTSHATGGGEWTASVTASGNAYESSGASGIAMVKGSFTAAIDNWQGGSKTISFGRTFKSPPTVVWYTPDPSPYALADDWTINITNITTTGCTISWGAQTGGATHELGWIAEGPV